MPYIIYSMIEHKCAQTVSTALKTLSVQLRCTLSVTLLFVTRNLLVPEIVCGGLGTPTPCGRFSCQTQAGVGAEEWGWGGSGCGLRMDNKYAVYELAWVQIIKSFQSSMGSFESKSRLPS